VSRYQKGKTNLDFTEARESKWQWHQLDHMQVCTLLQTDIHASTPPLSFLQATCPSCHPTNSVKALKAPVRMIQRDKMYLNVLKKLVGSTLQPLSYMVAQKSKKNQKSECLDCSKTPGRQLGTPSLLSAFRARASALQASRLHGSTTSC